MPVSQSFYRPPLAAGHVPRSRLCARLQAGLQGRLMLVCGPAGSGKTSLALEFCSRSSAERQSLWVALDRRDGEPGRFIERLLGSLSSALPGFGAAALELLRLRQPHQPFAFEQLLDGVIEEMQARIDPQRPILLVIDDYHLAQGSVADACLQYLLDHLPAGLCLLVCTRARPAWHLARLRLARQVLELSEADLRMDHAEVEQLLGPALVAEADLGELLARSEGWVAGLRLWQWMRERGSPEADRAPPRMHGDEGVIREYLLEEVISHQPEPVRDFLFATAHLEQFCADLCDQVREAHDSASIIEHLQTHQLFLVPLDEQGVWFRYHHLFSDLLRARPCLPDVSLSTLHLRACRWFAARGQFSEAVEEALRAGRTDVAASLVQSLSEEQLLTEQSVTLLLRWKRELPDSLLASAPRLILLYGWALALACQLDAADDLLAALGRFLPAASAAQQQALLAQGQALSGFIARARGDLPRARQDCRQAAVHLPVESFGQRLMCLSSLAGIALADGELVQARTLQREALELTQRVGNPLLEALVRADRAWLLAARGEPARAREEVASGLLRIAGLCPQRRYASRGRLAVVEGELLYLGGDLAAARRRLREGVEELRACRDLMVVRGYACLARVDADDLSLEAGFAALAEAESLMHAWDVPAICYLAFVTLRKCELWLGLGRLDLAEPWLERLHRTYATQAAAVPELAPFLAQEVRLQHALLGELRSGKGAALQSLEELRATLERMGAGALLLKLDIERVRLLACQCDGRARRLLRELVAVERSVQRQAFVRLQGLPQLAGELPWRNTSTPPEEPPAEALSKREQAVLQLIAAGLSNQQISERLFISLPTVKTHARNINAKLGVQRRTEAVARAQRHGWLG